jgi:lipopolysaccharide export system permease protein
MILKSKQKNIIQNYANNSIDSLNKTQDVLSLFNKNKKIKLLEFGINSVKNIKQDLKVKSKSVQIATTNLNKHIIAFHDKFALGLMCIILFFVGAPLGALIRKGGIGLPMVIAILIFLTYHFISIFAKNS